MLSGTEMIMLELALCGLHSLQWEFTGSRHSSLELALSKIGGFTTLTRVELRTFWCRFPDSLLPLQVRPLQILPLQELALLDCDKLELQLIVPGALTSLRRLHIEVANKGQQDSIEAPSLAKGLTPCGEVLLSLPHLSQLSGFSASF